MKNEGTCIYFVVWFLVDLVMHSVGLDGEVVE